MKEICFVVLNYFSHEKVAKLIASMPFKNEVCGVVVDNSANDEEFSALSSSCARGDITFIQSDRNGGFSYGTNIGIEFGMKRANSILVLNPDTEVTPEFFDTLINLRKAMPDVVVSPHGIRMHNGETWSAGGKFYWLRGRADVLSDSKRSCETQFGTCACLLVPKAAIEQVGELDEDFFLGGEEWDYSLRLRQAGWPILYASRAVYKHEVSGTHEKYGLLYFYIGMRTKVLFARKHYGFWFWPWLLFFLLPSSPFLLWRNSRLDHGNISKLIPCLFVAVLKSTRAKKISQQETAAICN